MRNNVKWLALAGLALATTGCVEQMDGSYSSYGYEPGYYAAAPTYYTPYYEPTRVVTRTQYVPVPVPVQEPQRTFQADRRSNDQPRTANRGDNRPQPQVNPPQQNRPQQKANGSQAHNQQSNGGNRQTNTDNNRGNNHRQANDRDGDGKPDRRS